MATARSSAALAARPSAARAGSPATKPRRSDRTPVTRKEPVRARRRQPSLQVVIRRRRAMRLAMALGALLFVLLIGVTAFWARLAQSQLELDRTDTAISAQRERYDQLRQQRAELLAPQRLMDEADALGMVPGEATQFVEIPAEIVAQVAVSASGVPDASRRSQDDPFEEYGRVKATVDGTG